MKFIRSRKLFENLQQAKSLLKKNNIDLTDTRFIKLKELLKGKEGYLGWFTDKMINDWSIDSLEYIIKDINNSKNLFDLIDLNNVKSYEDYVDQRIRAKEYVNAKKAYNEFPRTQKNLINLNKTDRDLIKKLNDIYLHPSKDILLNKISRYKTTDDLLNAIDRVLNSDNKDFQEQLEFLQKIISL